MNIDEYEAWKITYCARCDSAVGVEERDGRRFCAVCWKHAKPVPTTLDRMIRDLLSPGTPGQEGK